LQLTFVMPAAVETTKGRTAPPSIGRKRISLSPVFAPGRTLGKNVVPQRSGHHIIRRSLIDWVEPFRVQAESIGNAKAAVVPWPGALSSVRVPPNT
jgi:hypothetical protein